jgi:hypothetical protein
MDSYGHLLSYLTCIVSRLASWARAPLVWLMKDTWEPLLKRSMDSLQA